jgi:parallel beta-helix repeat protein
MKRLISGSTLLLTALFISVTSMFGFTIIVDCNGGGDYDTIQDGIDAAVDGDTVLVAPCTYTGLGNRDIDFGGKEIVVMSSDGPEVTIVDAEGAGRGFLFQNGETIFSVLDGFTVTNGYATGYGYGGGIYIDSSSPTITNCHIVNNTAERHGGGIYSVSGHPDINHCVIEGNSVDALFGLSNGGGIYLASYNLYGSGPKISHCTFKDNAADGHGGGLYYYDVQPQFAPYSFIWGCTFTGNRADDGFGAYFKESKVSIYNCLFENNQPVWLSGNGGGIYLYESNDVLVHNCTLVNNAADGIHLYNSDPTIYNCILYWDGTYSGDEIIGLGSPTVTYSNVYGGWPGTGNIDTDPLFVEEVDYHLDEDSPCVDAGDPAILDGSMPPGMGGDRSDMGAYGGSDNGEWLEGPYDLFLYPTGPTTVTAGEIIFFDALIWNSTDNPATGYYWISLVMPDSREILFPPALLNHSNPLYGTTQAHGTNTISTDLQTLLTGTYTVIGRIGAYPNVVIDEESFEVVVVQ